MIVARRLLPILAVALAAVPAGLSAAAPDDRAQTPALEFAGEAIVPSAFAFAGTTVGGLSGIAYDEARNVFYGLSDDPSQFQPARFYTLGVDISDGRLETGDVRFFDVTTLRDDDGQPFASFSLDPEGIALTRDDRLVVTSEGAANAGIDPFVRLFELDGTSAGALPVPEPFLTTPAASSGVRQNLGFESAAVTPNGRFFFTGTEAALFQDGPPATVTAGSRARLLRYHLGTGRVDREYVYVTDPIAEPPVPATAFAVSGLVELLPLNSQFLLSMERSFSVGAPGTGNTIRLYRVALPGAGDASPVQKSLLLDLDELGIPLDNIEGMAFGPDLPDGRRSLLLVSDNNFSAAQFTQFLLFAVSPG